VSRALRHQGCSTSQPVRRATFAAAPFSSCVAPTLSAWGTVSETAESPHACGGEPAVFEMLGQSYLLEAAAVVGRIAATQATAIQKAADVIACSLRDGGLLYLFGTGHSASVAVEPYHRAGGLVPVRPIVEPAMTLHDSPAKATALERLEGYAKILIAGGDGHGARWEATFADSGAARTVLRR